MKTYEIVRFYKNPNKRPTVLQGGYDLEQARAYCDDSELSSMTAQPPKGCGGNEKKIAKWHEKQKHWFVGFRSEQ